MGTKRLTFWSAYASLQVSEACVCGPLRVSLTTRFVIVVACFGGPLCDLFEGIITWLRVTCLDVNMRALTC